MSVRILHAADLHLDSPFEALTLAQAAQRRREQRDLLRALPDAYKNKESVWYSLRDGQPMASCRSPMSCV